MTKKSVVRRRFVLVGNSGYGLYVGYTAATDEMVIATRAVRLEQCRHVRYWYGRSGGITSLAAYGPCGPRVAESRIGAACPSALVTQIVNIYDCTEEARQNFDSVNVS